MCERSMLRTVAPFYLHINANEYLPEHPGHRSRYAVYWALQSKLRDIAETEVICGLSGEKTGGEEHVRMRHWCFPLQFQPNK